MPPPGDHLYAATFPIPKFWRVQIRLFSFLHRFHHVGTEQLKKLGILLLPRQV